MWRWNLYVGFGFSATGTCIRCCCILNGLFRKRFTHTHLLKNTNKFWLMITAFYHFTTEFSTRETITTKTKHFVFFWKFFQSKSWNYRSCNIWHRKLFSYPGTKRLIRILKSDSLRWTRLPWTHVLYLSSVL